MPINYLPTSRMPSAYEQQIADARRRQAMAEALEAQAYRPLSGSDAPTPAAAPLVAALQSFMSARQRKKSMESAEKAKDLEGQYAERMLGRMQGGFTYKPNAELEQQMAKKPEETLDQYTQRMETTPFTAKAAVVPKQDKLAEVMRQSQYRRAPEEALGMASTSLGTAALRDRPLMAQRLAKALETPKLPEVYGNINPKDFTPDSVKAFDETVKQGAPNYSLLKPAEKPEDKGLKIGSISPSDFTPDSIKAATAANDITLLKPVPKSVDPAAAERGRITLEDKYRREFDNAVKPDLDELAQIGKVKTILGSVPPGGKPNAIQQDVLVTLLMKFIEPGSVVREGEYDRLVSRQGLVARAQTLMNKIQTGEPLTGEALNQIAGLANLFNEAATNRVRKRAGQISTLAGNRGLSVENIILDPTYLQKPIDIGSSLSGKPTGNSGSGWTPQLEAELQALEAKQGGKK